VPVHQHARKQQHLFRHFHCTCKHEVRPTDLLKDLQQPFNPPPNTPIYICTSAQGNLELLWCETWNAKYATSLTAEHTISCHFQESGAHDITTIMLTLVCFWRGRARTVEHSSSTCPTRSALRTFTLSNPCEACRGKQVSPETTGAGACVASSGLRACHMMTLTSFKCDGR